jgi:GTPase SAR1 family protein
MPVMTNPEFSLDALSQATQVRTQMAIALQQIQALTTASHQMEQGVFRLVVLGDMKRGKSTLINALLGETVLPSNVNPCTALLTIL